jgi:hypothetical protein
VLSSDCNRPLYSTRQVVRPSCCFAVQGMLCCLSQPIKISLNFTVHTAPPSATTPSRVCFSLNRLVASAFAARASSPSLQRSAAIAAHNLAVRHHHIKQTTTNQDSAQKFLLKIFLFQEPGILIPILPPCDRKLSEFQCKQRKQT